MAWWWHPDIHPKIRDWSCSRQSCRLCVAQPCSHRLWYEVRPPRLCSMAVWHLRSFLRNMLAIHQKMTSFLDWTSTSSHPPILITGSSKLGEMIQNSCNSPLLIFKKIFIYLFFPTHFFFWSKPPNLTFNCLLNCLPSRTLNRKKKSLRTLNFLLIL